MPKILLQVIAIYVKRKPTHSEKPAHIKINWKYPLTPMSGNAWYGCLSTHQQESETQSLEPQDNFRKSSTSYKQKLLSVMGRNYVGHV